MLPLQRSEGLLYKCKHKDILGIAYPLGRTHVRIAGSFFLPLWNHKEKMCRL